MHPRRLAAALSAASLLACGPKQAVTAPTPVAPASAAPAEAVTASPPRIDPERLYGVVAHLASDALGGRYTLSEDIHTAAAYLGEQMRSSGVQPVGTDYVHPFTLVTGARATAPPALNVAAGKRTTPVPAADFGPLPGSASGKVEAEAVFVGYAAKTEGYDDLAGVDVRGRVAIVLMHQPGRPDARAFFRWLRAEQRELEAAVEPLREAEDAAGIRELYAAHLREVRTVAAPWIDGRKLKVEAVLDALPPGATLDSGAVLTALEAARRDGPPPGRRPSFSGWSRDSEKIERLAESGASAVILVHGPRSFVDAAARQADELPALQGDRPVRRSYPIPVVRMKWRAADRLLRVGGAKISALQKRIDTTLVPASKATGRTIALDVALEPIEVRAPNVLATIPGSDLAEEIVVLGAHFDHIGRDGPGQGDCHGSTLADGSLDRVCNGADDNASGTATVVEIARALGDAGYRPRRTLVFALFSGEELGLLGSNALVDAMPKAPPFSEGRVVAMVNIDMIGRLGEKGLAIGGVGSSSAWMEILDAVGTEGMPILYDRAITTRSDHAAFYGKQIPVVFLFTHTHADYHAPGDEADRINREGLADVARLVQGIALQLGDGHAIPFTPPRTPEEGLVRALPGDNPDTVERRVGS